MAGLLSHGVRAIPPISASGVKRYRFYLGKLECWSDSFPEFLAAVRIALRAGISVTIVEGA